MAAMKIDLHQLDKKLILENYFSNSVVTEANGLEPRSGPTYMGPDLGSRLCVTV